MLHIGVKLVDSTPMTRAEWCKYRGWELPADENGDDEGYLVEYLDGGVSNHPNHKGYISWSPKEVFDKAYYKEAVLKLITKELAPHQERVIAEEKALDDNCSKLNAFTTTEIFKNLPQEEQNRLKAQYVAMTAYLWILRDRINNF